MTDHHPLQQELAIKAAAADVAQKRLDELRARRSEVTGRVHELGNGAGAARLALREAAGANAAGEGDAKAVEKARKALRDAESESELGGIELEGIDARIQQAERELAGKRRAMCIAGTDICQVSVAILEEEARTALGRFAELVRRRHALAKLAALLSTEAAGGRFSEPIRYSDDYAGLFERSNGENLLSVLGEHNLTSMFAPAPGLAPADLGDLLEIELPRTAEAAE